MKRTFLATISALLLASWQVHAEQISGGGGGGGGGGVTSFTTTCPASGPSTGAVTISFLASVNAQVGTSYTILTTDCNKLITQSNAAASTYTWPASGTLPQNFVTTIENIGAGTLTINAAAGGSINGASSLTLTQYQSAQLVASDTNGIIVQALIGKSGSGSVVNDQIFTANGTWTAPAGITVVRVYGCGGGGGGGSGATTVSATAISGGAGGGGAVCFEKWFKASDVGASQTVTIGTQGSVGAAVSTATTNGNNGGSGGNTTFGSLVTFFGGGGGGGGRTAGANSTGGAGGSRFAAGGVGTTTPAIGCDPGNTQVANGGGAGTIGASQPGTCGGGGGGSAGTNGAPNSGAYTSVGAPGGESGGGIQSVASTATGAGGQNGGASPGCQSPPVGGGVGTGGGAAVPPDFNYNPGCGGAGGGGAITGTGGTGSAGTAGGGGGGGGGACLSGGTCTATASGAGGLGGAGFLRVTAY